MRVVEDKPARRKAFLSSLTRPKVQEGEPRYRRYLGAPIRYAGGKSYAVGYVVECLPENLELVVSPFLGGGSVEVALAKELGLRVVAYDIFEILVVFWQVLLDPVEKGRMLGFLEGLRPDRRTYEEVKRALKDYWAQVQAGERREGPLAQDRALLAAYYFFNHQLSYGPGFLGWPSSVYLNERAYARALEKLAEFHAPTLEVRHGDFREVLPRHRGDFLYLDPPYYIGPGSKTFVGLYPMRNFPVHHRGFPHDLLRNMLLEHEGGFVLSYNDCPTVREWYGGFELRFPKWPYSMGQGETRVGKHRRERGAGDHRKESHEVLICAPRRPRGE